MHAFPAARRTFLLLGALALLAPLAAQADSHQGYLGVMLQDLSPSMGKALRMGDREGVLINEVIDDSPADRAGLESGDVIMRFAGEGTGDYEALTEAVGEAEPGEEVEIVVLRDGKEKKLEVILGAREEMAWIDAEDGHFEFEHGEWLEKLQEGEHDFHVMMSPDGKKLTARNITFFGDRGFMGVHLDDLSGQLGEYFGVADGQGALITEVGEDSPAAAAGLKAGDVIVRIGDDDIDSAAEVHEEMEDTEAGQEIEVTVVRKGKRQTMDVTLGEMPEDLFAGSFGNVMVGDERVRMIAPRIEVLRDRHGHGDDAEVIIRRLHDHEPLKEMKLHKMHRGGEDLDEVREELEELRKELQELRDDLKKSD